MLLCPHILTLKHMIDKKCLVFQDRVTELYGHRRFYHSLSPKEFYFFNSCRAANVYHIRLLHLTTKANEQSPARPRATDELPYTIRTALHPVDTAGPISVHDGRPQAKLNRLRQAAGVEPGNCRGAR